MAKDVTSENVHMYRIAYKKNRFLLLLAASFVLLTLSFFILPTWLFVIFSLIGFVSVKEISHTNIFSEFVLMDSYEKNSSYETIFNIDLSFAKKTNKKLDDLRNEMNDGYKNKIPFCENKFKNKLKEIDDEFQYNFNKASRFVLK